MNEESPRIGQEAFAIVSQILEFWQLNYFSESVNEASSGKDDTSVMQTSKGIKVDEEEKNSQPVQQKGLRFGKTISAKLKPDGAWNFHTILRDISDSGATFEAIFSRPSSISPVPKANGSVWFQLTKKVRLALANFRYIHVLGM